MTNGRQARPDRLDAVLLRRWAVAARAALGAHRESIDELNVFPVPDADTGTNMFLTLDAAVEATLDPTPAEAGSAPDDLTPELDRFVRAALLGARGNSGVIVSQLVRGFVETVRGRPGGPTGGIDARGAAEAFDGAVRAAYAAVGEPEEGTILTVAQACARAARAAADEGGDLLDAVEAACAAGRVALDATTSQLGALSDAGVVDAGGAGLVVVLEALRRVLSGGAEPVGPVAARTGVDAPHPCAEADYEGPRYEVMFVVESGLPEALDDARAALHGIGDSVLLVGGGPAGEDGRSGPWRGHVHTDRPEAVADAVAGFGEVSGCVTTDLFSGERADLGAPPREGLVLVAAVDGPALRGVARSAGAVAVPRAGGLDAVRAAVGQDRPAAVLLGDGDLVAQARAQVPGWAAGGEDVVVLDAPTDAHVLAALAVHDPGLPADAARSALAAAVAAVAADVLPAPAPRGDAEALARSVRDALDRLAAAAGEVALVTVVAGAADPEAAAAVVAGAEELVTAVCPGAEVSVVDGGDPGYALTIGVEG